MQAHETKQLSLLTGKFIQIHSCRTLKTRGGLQEVKLIISPAFCKSLKISCQNHFAKINRKSMICTVSLRLSASCLLCCGRLSKEFFFRK